MGVREKERKKERNRRERYITHTHTEIVLKTDTKHDTALKPEFSAAQQTQLKLAKRTMATADGSDDDPIILICVGMRVLFYETLWSGKGA